MKRSLHISSKYVILLWGVCWSFYILFDKLINRVVREPSVLCRTQDLHIGPIISDTIFRTWLRWDTICYLLIAERGYSFNKFLSVWPPLYPFLIKLISFSQIPGIISALIISLLSTIAAYCILFRMVNLQAGEYKARQTLLLYSIFPFSFFFIAGYTESLFLALVLGTLFFADEKKWWIAGVLGSFAVLTRNQGILLSPVLLIEGFLVARKLPKPRWFFSPSFFFAIIMPIIVFFSFSIYIRYFVSFAWPWDELTKIWAQHWAFPWQGILGNLRALLYGEHNTLWFFWFPSRLIDLFMATMVPIILIINHKNFKPSHQIFAWLIYLSSVSKVGEGDVLISFSRYMLPIFPFFISISSILNNRFTKLLLLFICLSLTGIFLGLFYIWGWAG